MRANFRSVAPVGAGFVLGGETRDKGKGDFLLVCLTSAGDSLWSVRAGGDEEESYCSAFPAAGGWYLMAGNTYSFKQGWGSDALGVKVNPYGLVEWSWTFGCGGQDQFRVAGSVPGGYFFAGTLEGPCTEADFHSKAH